MNERVFLPLLLSGWDSIVLVLTLEFPHETIWDFRFLLGEFIDYKFNFLNSKYLFHIRWVMIVCTFWGTGSFYLSHHVFILRVVHSISLLSFWMCAWSVVISLFYVWLVMVFFLSVPFVSLIGGLSIPSVFSKNQFFVSLIFLFNLIDFCACFIIYFLLFTLALFWYSSGFFKWDIRLLI